MLPDPLQRRRGRRDRRFAGAVAISAVVHLAVFWAVGRTLFERQPPPRPAPIAVTLVDARGEPPPSAAPAPLTAGARPPERAASAGAQRRTAPVRGERGGAARPGERGSTGAAALVDEGLAPAPGDGRAPDLRPRASVVAPPAGAPGPGARGSAGTPDPLRRWADDLAARARVENGLANPYHSDLAKALAHQWEVERVVKARGLAGWLSEAGDNLATFGRTWARIAETYGRTGQPSVIDGASERFRELSGLPPGPARDALARAEVARQLRQASSEGHVASVRVVQGRGGRLESVELASPSRDAALDRAALDAVPRAVERLPAPPEVLAGRERIATLWEFEIEVSITPPLPVAGIEFDEVLGSLDLRVPLDRRIWKRVRLVAIE